MTCRGMLSRDDLKRFFWRLEHQMTHDLRECTFHNTLILYLSWLIHIKLLLTKMPYTIHVTYHMSHIICHIWVGETISVKLNESYFLTQKQLRLEISHFHVVSREWLRNCNDCYVMIRNWRNDGDLSIFGLTFC